MESKPEAVSGVSKSDSDSEDVKSVSKQVKPTVKSKRDVRVVFRENRKFDLHVGRETVVFMGREEKKIPREWLDHADFRQVQSKFIIKGV